jgi:glycosyltransferase involved in cell wall biosynthesis
MRIAVYHELPSGGAKRALYEIARRLAISHTVDVFTLSTADSDFCDLRPVVNQHTIVPFQPQQLLRSPFGRLNQFQRWRELVRLDRLSQAVAAGIDRQAYDVVYTHPSRYTQAPCLLNHLATPTVHQAQEALRLAYEAPIPRPYQNSGTRSRLDRVDPLIRLYQSRLRAIDRRSIRRANRLLANSKFTAANLLRIYGRMAEISYLGVDLESFRPARPPGQRSGALSVGELRPNKGFDFLIESLALIEPSRRPALRLVGNAALPLERRYLLELADQLQVSVQIETDITQAELAQRYHEAALVLYAPINEPLGFVPLEAMACETPVVAVAEGGILETVEHDTTGWLTRRSLSEFAAAVETLLADPVRRERLARRGRQVVEAEWTWDRTLFSVETALAEAARHPLVAA